MTDLVNQETGGSGGDDDDHNVTAEDEEEEEEEGQTGYGNAETLQTIAYIRETFKKRVCYSFVPNAKISDLCQCGYDREDHADQDDLTEKKASWSVEGNTKTEVTDAFGVVEFPAFGQKTSKYIRVDHETDVSDLWTLMSERWAMEKPHLLISVTGGAQKLSTEKRLKTELKEVFRKGLIGAAQSTGAWIITGGTNTGVMKLVGDAIRAHTLKQGSRKQLVAIGIATWGCISNRKALTEETRALYEIVEPVKDVKEAPLDPNHTHFILVDNGTQHDYGAEIKLRAALEKKISGMESCGVKIPIVCIAIEGGKNTIETVVQAITANTPVIVVDGSGRAADVLAYACNHFLDPTEDLQKQKSVEESNRKLWEELRPQIVKYCGGENALGGVVTNIEYCLDHRNMITVFPLDGKGSAGSIEYAIIMTLLRVKEGATSTLEKMELALAWDRIDVVKEYIYTTDEAKLSADQVKKLAFTAIVNNRVEFVKFFLERHLLLGELLEAKKINEFYTKGMEKNKHLKNALKDVTDLEENLGGLDRFIRKKVDHLFNPSHLRRQQLRRILHRQHSSHRTGQSINLERIGKTTVATEDAAVDLFFWSVLCRLQSMAIVFLREAKETFALSLIGHLMLKNLLKTEKDGDSKQELQNQVDFFEGLTTGLLTECYSSNQEMTIDLLVRPIPTFDRHTALEIAVQANNQSVLAHQACQNLLTVIWMGRIRDDNSYFLSCLLRIPPLFFFAPLFLKFREDSSPETSEITKDNKKKTTENQKRKASEVSAGKSSVRPVVGRSTNENHGCSMYCKRLSYFLNAPCVKFTFNCMSYVGFLLLYSIVLLTNFYPTMSVSEMVLIGWVATIVCEEIRQLVEGREGDSRKIHNYLTNRWNWVDLIAVATFSVGLVLRLVPWDGCFFAARIVHAFSLMTFYFRILHMFSIFRQLGPKLVMIGKMMIDLSYFMTILMVFITAYGIASHVILYPNQELRLSLVQDVLSGAWWSVYGEFHIEEVSGESCEALPTQTSSAEDCASMEYDDFNRTLCPGKEEKCPAIDWFGPILLAIYALITNVMMINLLIAMFSNTFSKIEEIADVIWKIQRYHLVLDYESHPILPPPLIIVDHVFRLIRFIWRKSGCHRRRKRAGDGQDDAKKSRNRTFRMVLGDHYERNLIAWLSVNVEEYLLKKDTEDAAAERLARETNDRIDRLYRKIEETDQTKSLDTRLKSLEEKMNEILSILSPNRKISPDSSLQ